MSSEKDKVVGIENHFRALSSHASSLNKASDELTRTVGLLDAALKDLNIGLTTWVTFSDWGEEGSRYGMDQLGYAKIGGKWGIAIRKIWGDESFDDHHEEGPWLFGEAPREFRIRASDYFEKLLQTLGKEAFDTVKKIEVKTKEVATIAAVIGEIAKEQKHDARGAK
jgi:hypothetical protein